MTDFIPLWIVRFVHMGVPGLKDLRASSPGQYPSGLIDPDESEVLTLRAPIFTQSPMLIRMLFSFQMNGNCADRKVSIVGNNNIVHFNARTNTSDAQCGLFESSLSTDIMLLIIVSLGIFVFCTCFCFCHSRNRMRRGRSRAMLPSDSETIAHV